MTTILFLPIYSNRWWIGNRTLLPAVSRVCLGLYLLPFSPSLSSRLPLTSFSQPLWLTAVTTCCANWKRPWLVLFPNHSGWCPVVFPSAGGWQLAFRLRHTAAWTLASPCQPLALHTVYTRSGLKPHKVEGNCRLAPFPPAVWLQGAAEIVGVKTVPR